MPAIARPVDVVRSSASLSETKPMLRSVSSWSVVTRSSRERPHRSSRQTSTTSISRRCAASINCWRCSRCTAPDPTSLTCRATVQPRFARSHAWHASHRESLLIERGDTRVEPCPQHFRGFACVAKNLLRFCLAGSAFYGHFGAMRLVGRRLFFSATIRTHATTRRGRPPASAASRDKSRASTPRDARPDRLCAAAVRPDSRTD
jgi:hypothetical protein